jgi:hypothetical protein
LLLSAANRNLTWQHYIVAIGTTTAAKRLVPPFHWHHHHYRKVKGAFPLVLAGRCSAVYQRGVALDSFQPRRCGDAVTAHCAVGCGY